MIVNVACATLAGAILASFLVKVTAPLMQFAPLREAIQDIDYLVFRPKLIAAGQVVNQTN